VLREETQRVVTSWSLLRVALLQPLATCTRCGGRAHGGEPSRSVERHTRSRWPPASRWSCVRAHDCPRKGRPPVGPPAPPSEGAPVWAGAGGDDAGRAGRRTSGGGPRSGREGGKRAGTRARACSLRLCLCLPWYQRTKSLTGDEGKRRAQRAGALRSARAVRRTP
jgi:hypothetical protein